MDEEQQMDIVDTNQPQNDSSIMINQLIETSNRSQTRNHPARYGRKQLHMVSMRTSTEQPLNCREVGFEMAIYLYQVA